MIIIIMLLGKTDDVDEIFCFKICLEYHFWPKRQFCETTKSKRTRILPVIQKVRQVPGAKPVFDMNKSFFVSKAPCKLHVMIDLV